VNGAAGQPGLQGINGTVGGTGSAGFGLVVPGRLITGAGRDTVDAREGGFGGGGLIDLGSDNDRVIGFGDISLNGGPGEDSLLLPGLAGDFIRSVIPGGASFSRGEITLNALGFEQIAFIG